MKVLTTKQASEKIGVTDSQVRRLIREGHIKAKKIGWSYIIEERHVEGYKRRRSPNGTRKSYDGSK